MMPSSNSRRFDVQIRCRSIRRNRAISNIPRAHCVIAASFGHPSISDVLDNHHVHRAGRRQGFYEIICRPAGPQGRHEQSHPGLELPALCRDGSVCLGYPGWLLIRHTRQDSRQPGEKGGYVPNYPSIATPDQNYGHNDDPEWGFRSNAVYVIRNVVQPVRNHSDRRKHIRGDSPRFRSRGPSTSRSRGSD